MKFSVSRCELVVITIKKLTVNNELNKNKINKFERYSESISFPRSWADHVYIMSGVCLICKKKKNFMIENELWIRKWNGCLTLIFYEKYFLWQNGFKAFLFWCDNIHVSEFSKCILNAFIYFNGMFPYFKVTLSEYSTLKMGKLFHQAKSLTARQKVLVSLCFLKMGISVLWINITFPCNSVELVHRLV